MVRRVTVIALAVALVAALLVIVVTCDGTRARSPGPTDVSVPAAAPNDPDEADVAGTPSVRTRKRAKATTVAEVQNGGAPRETAHSAVLGKSAVVYVHVVRDDVRDNVRGDGGAPVADAMTWLAPGRLGASGEPAVRGDTVARAPTDADGRAILVGAAPREWAVVFATAPGCVRGAALVRPEKAGDVHVEIRLAPGGVIAGVVLDADGAPVRASVLARAAAGGGDDESALSKLRTLEDGSFRFEGLPLEGLYDLDVGGPKARVRRIVAAVRASPPESAERIVVRLPRPARLTVHAAGFGAPGVIDEGALEDDVHDVDVLRLPAAPGAAAEISTPLDTPVELSAGRYRLSLARSHRSPGAQAVVDLPAGGEVEVTLKMRPACALPGRVVDSAGLGVAGAGVTAALVGSDDVLEALTDAGGEFLLPCVTAGTWVVSTETEGDTRAAADVWVDLPVSAPVPAPFDGSEPVRPAEPPRLAPVTLKLVAPASFLVRFPPESRGRNNWVRFERPLPPGAADSDGDEPDGWTEEGGFGNNCQGDEEWDGCAPGRWRIVARIEGFRPWVRELVLAPGERRVVDVGPLDAAVSVTGAVVDPAGAPVEGARVSLVDGTWDAIAKATEADGAFGPIATSVGRAVFHVFAQGFAPSRVALDARPGLPPVRVVVHRGGFAEVRVRHADGSPATSVPLRVRYPDADEEVTTWFDDPLVTDARGVCRVYAEPGRYRVRIGDGTQSEVVIGVEIDVEIEDERTTVWTATLP